MRHHRVYLRNLLRRSGYDIDWSAFSILTAHHPQLACALIDAGCQLACTAAADVELRHAADTLANMAADPGTVTVAAPLLAAVTHTRVEITERGHNARARLHAACTAISDSGFGVLWPTTPQTDSPAGPSTAAARS
ncbi:MAG: hypothetical protein ACRDT6_13085 [Micromonosporaceae bacterium]